MHLHPILFQTGTKENAFIKLLKTYITVIYLFTIKFMENISDFQPDDRVLVSFETEVIYVRADGTVLVRMVGIPIEPHNLTLINKSGGRA